MGRDRRTIDSDGVEAKVDSGNEALNVHTFFDSTADLDTIEATLTNIEKALASVNTDYLKVQMRDASDNLMPSMDVAARKGFVAVTDGTHTLDLVRDGDGAALTKPGVVIYGRRDSSGATMVLPLCDDGDAKANKFSRMVPVILGTGGREEGTFTRGFIPTTEVLDLRADSTAPGAWDTITTYTVPAGNTLHITSWVLSLTTIGAGIEYLGRIKLGATAVAYARAPSGGFIHFVFSQPLKAVAEVVVDIDFRHWASVNITTQALIQGFLTVDSELD
jgi:hypothetical protein